MDQIVFSKRLIKEDLSDLNHRNLANLSIFCENCANDTFYIMNRKAFCLRCETMVEFPEKQIGMI